MAPFTLNTFYRMTRLGSIGGSVIVRWRNWCRLASLVALVVRFAATPRCWTSTVRRILAKQVLFTGIEAVNLVLLIAVLAGVSVVVQAQVWLARLGQSEMLGPILVGIVFRELGPLLVNFIVIGRSGTAVAIELGNMRVGREIHILEAQGVEPIVYLIMPRVLGMAASIFALTMVLCAVAMLSGFAVGVLLGVTPPEPSVFVNSVFRAVRLHDVWNVLAKTLLSGLMIGSICCTEGLMITGVVTEVPQAGTRAVMESITAVLVVSAIVSVFTYA